MYYLFTSSNKSLSDVTFGSVPFHFSIYCCLIILFVSDSDTSLFALASECIFGFKLRLFATARSNYLLLVLCTFQRLMNYLPTLLAYPIPIRFLIHHRFSTVAWYFWFLCSKNLSLKTHRLLLSPLFRTPLRMKHIIVRISQYCQAPFAKPPIV